ncbi:MAG TPA: DUF1176 domain-containing protein, partial [Rhodothermales bacterium]|nr:DUF1176 domain-containing protein [Rhodothermales bacterium]
ALLLMLPALVLAACSGSNRIQPPADGFDARAWMTRSAAVWDTTAWGDDYEGRRALSRQYANELDDALGVVEACDLWNEARTDEEVAWGGMSREPLGGDEYLVRVDCEFFAYQGTFVYVHVDGARAAIVRAPRFYEGTVGEPTPLFLGYADLDLGRRRFSVFAKSRGMGDCGTYDTFEVQRVGEPATLVEARYRSCDVEIIDEDIPGPEDYPVVYPTR